MSSPRSLLRIHTGMRDDIGDLITRRPLPGAHLQHLDPFLFLNHHGPQTYPANNRGLPFGPHPHRGFETVTFILEGSLAHQDSGGHESIIDAGGVQWMTAGLGLVHAELSPEAFLRRGGPLEILQLWVNLPARLKMAEPCYIGLQREELPLVSMQDGTVQVQCISGDWAGQRAPIRSLTDVQISTVTIAAGARATFPIARGRTVFLYVVRGELNLGSQCAQSFQLVQLEDDGDEVVLAATSDTVLLLGHAEPLREPIVAHGPFVMNTREEIMQAVRDYQTGRFG